MSATFDYGLDMAIVTAVDQQGPAGPPGPAVVPAGQTRAPLDGTEVFVLQTGERVAVNDLVTYMLKRVAQLQRIAAGDLSPTLDDNPLAALIT